MKKIGPIFTSNIIQIIFNSNISALAVVRCSVTLMEAIGLWIPSWKRFLVVPTTRLQLMISTITRSLQEVVVTVLVVVVEEKQKETFDCPRSLVIRRLLSDTRALDDTFPDNIFLYQDYDSLGLIQFSIIDRSGFLFAGYVNDGRERLTIHVYTSKQNRCLRIKTCKNCFTLSTKP